MRLFYFLILNLLLASCAKIGGSNEETHQAPSQIKSEIDGSWASGCMQDTPGTEVYLQLFESFTDGLYVQAKKYFKDKKCQYAYEYMDITTMGRYVVGDAVPSPAGSKKLTIQITKVYYEPRKSVQVTLFNNSGMCGFTDWKDWDAKDVTETNCNRFGFGGFLHTIYQLNTGILKLGVVDVGTEHDGSTDAKRADTLSPVNYIFFKD